MREKPQPGQQKKSSENPFMRQNSAKDLRPCPRPGTDGGVPRRSICKYSFGWRRRRFQRSDATDTASNHTGCRRTLIRRPIYVEVLSHYKIRPRTSPGRNHSVGPVVFARSFCARASSFGACRSMKDMRAPDYSPCAKISMTTTPSRMVTALACATFHCISYATGRWIKLWEEMVALK